MPIHKGDTFRKHPYNAGHLFVSQRLPELSFGLGSRLATRITFPSLADCDPDTNPPDKRELDVVYKVYTVSASNYPSRSFELGRREEVKRGVTDTPATRRLAKYFVQPYGGYNGSRDAYGGGKLTVQLSAGPVQELTLEGAGSGSGSLVRGAVGSEFDRDEGLIRYGEWLAEYEYEDAPGDDFRLKRGTGRA